MSTPFTILYEDDTMLALEKPSGLVVHSDGRTSEPTLAELLLERLPQLRDVGGLHTLDSGRYVPRAGILHRLDRETSGVIAVAKTDDAFYFLQRQFLDRSVEKQYRAFVLGVPAPQSGMIELPIGRSRSDFRMWATGADARGTLRKASSSYEVLAENGSFAFLALSPKTGRTHQLRVHLFSTGHPILHDPRYGHAEGLGFTRLALHAMELSLTLPSGERKTFSAPLPPDFCFALASIEEKTVS